ncbi:MAG: HEAT repeat domain-containing protein [Gammaproteobacteria bacterium]|nr:MAG: HEAT repeat domain-containing protein [Gammaproteobacteria bacterium]
MAIDQSGKSLLFAGIIGAILFWVAGYLLAGDSDKDQTILSLENHVKDLETSLAQKEANLKSLRVLALRQNDKSSLVTVNTLTEICKQTTQDTNPVFPPNDNMQASVGSDFNGTQALRDLGTKSESDPRSFSEKVNDLLAANPTEEKIAVVSKSIVDMASNREIVPDYMLQSMYSTQTNPDLKRVIAQVLSNRGNNSLIDNQITEAQSQLKSENPLERQRALTQLAKTRSMSAANAITPLLNDPNIDVKLNALLALRATGNQTHVAYVEGLENDPDPAVSTLAKEVVGDLQNLSDSARTMLSVADISADLPMTQIP